MSGWGWVLVALVAWVGLSFAVAPLVGRWLRRISADYPAADQRVPENVRPFPSIIGSCVPEETGASGAPERRSSTS